MREALASIGNQLRSLLNFTGRDNRAAFWPYAGLVVSILFVAWSLFMGHALVNGMGSAQQLGSAQAAAGGLSGQTAPNFGAMIQAMEVLVLAAVALLAAAVTRRLHDSGRSGLWGLAPLPFLLFGLLAMSKIFHGFQNGGEPGTTALVAIFVNNIVYLAMLGLLIFFLAKPGTRGDNRYGPTLPKP
ncbi:DUF805 domain-containing protein [Stakelama marina]|uniref:DUF805 domain-containing protein n=1 Tax=Stakelama marina TaxID=2826939 RepID=A0A8T4IEG7_9SPHN|nr:DUF805 domain-containing protein [Stakelama marina]MBR0552244.1 DUF805 domain-containing protein [Stakelama marina]